MNGKCYVGSAEDLYTRAHSHFSLLRYGKHSNPHLQHSWKEHGAQAFSFEILEYVMRAIDLRLREQFYIDSFKASDSAFGFNMAAVSTRVPLTEEIRRSLASCKPGRVVAEETRQKIAASLAGRKLGPHSAEHKARIALAHLGKAKSAEHCANIAKARARQDPKSLAHPHTEETKRWIGELARRRYLDRQQ